MKTSLIQRLMSAAKQYSIFDFALLKLGLLAVGIIIGTYLHEFFWSNISVVAILAILCCGYVIYTTLRRAYPPKQKKHKNRK